MNIVNFIVPIGLLLFDTIVFITAVVIVTKNIWEEHHG